MLSLPLTETTFPGIIDGYDRGILQLIGLETKEMNYEVERDENFPVCFEMKDIGYI